MTANAKKIWLALGIAAAAFVAWLIFRALRDGVEKMKADFTRAVDLVTYPARALVSGAATVAGNAATAATLPSLANESAALDKQIVGNLNDYAPGGRIYERIAAERGTAAADDNWRRTQQNYSTMTADTSSWWNIWK